MRIVLCNKKIVPVPFAFQPDKDDFDCTEEHDWLSHNIQNLALLVSSKLALDTDDAGVWNIYARACIQKAAYNDTKAFALTFQCGIEPEHKTEPSNCICWSFLLPSEEILVSIVSREQHSQGRRTEIERMLVTLNLR